MKRVLIANRGEIAVRVIRACQDHGLESVSIYSDEDRNSLHAQMATHSYALGGVSAVSTYLNIPRIIEIAKELHGDKYDYSKVDYVNSITPVLIGCPEHGFFPQLPGSHLTGSGCPKCAGRDKTKEEFIKQAEEIHGKKYDYSDVDYKGAKTKIKIICIRF
jgi:hypothetical protein